ncbi:phospholipid-transporting ATPase, putative [Phytophthora infestans T30-4]|uniref:Phospholipid-transporting ATPase n=2 Tax=Phytophthora infestans TaxID=4787 RepID=D0NRR5_PHYIT|nr:phospholipid-transporting ATPase, putative [Phytophthora infestans T30-4]EEY63415.1 phospholipid-transporting ATPase, putative [Phytophthora infestans T30-4]KAF4046870.1 Pleckstrin homology domain-containing proteinoLip ATPase C [Phytophthora infestans]|eukprot:XP_002898300.1 phospholipid-transporting ATPase, putative [Phytophthora infestans T30-4]
MAAKRSTSRIFRGSRVEDQVALCSSVAPARDDSALSDQSDNALGSSTSGYNTLGSPALLQSPRQIRRKSKQTKEQLLDEDELVDYAAQHTPASTSGSGQPGAAAGAPGPDETLREVYFNYAPGNAVFDKCSNVVVTSKYNVATFLPKFLKESFSKVANFFFLMVCVLQSIPSISNTYGYPTNAPVLFFVISIDAVFAVMEDLRRHQSDNEANSATCHVIQDGQVVDKKWADIKVGDFLQIRNREVIPADVLVLAVAEPVGEPPSGICYVETKSLDGETNLKLRQAVAATMSSLSNAAELALLRGVIKCEQPNPHINKFAGKVEVTVGDGCGVEVMPLSVKNVLLRGCNLRNTDWVFCLVLNTGNDTKIMQSASAAPSKWSDLMLNINRMIVILCLGLFVACAMAATCYITWQYDIVRNAWYIQLSESERNRTRLVAFIQMLFYYFLLLYQVIPISLYVSMTSVKFLQSRFMSWDLEMYHAETDTPAIVRTMELNEELGQISYVFSDKTGTLTCNVMEFRKCSINGTSYGSGITEIGRAALVRAGKPIPPEPKLDPSVKSIPFVNFVDKSLFDSMKGSAGEEQKEKIMQFFEHLAVCHTVIPEKLESGEVRLSASSPDEQALVAGAAFAGFKFESRRVGTALVDVLGQRVTYEVLDVLEFNSTRKRMSVVVRKPSGELLLYTKGADMMIYQRLKDDPAMLKLKNITRDHMEKYADDGLRTLALAVKKLDERWFQQWKMRFDDAQGNVAEIDRRKDGKPNAIDALMEEIEEGLELIGATAIEDKLQDGVPQCLANLTRAGIKVWMLTGDKEETAINISYACSLLDNSIQQVIVNATTCPDEAAIRAKLNAAAREFLDGAKGMAGGSEKEISLVIDGEALEMALRPGTAPHLLSFAKLCRAVICNRVSPAQKAEMVKLVRDNITTVRTLAIGDGANDVAMIQAAHVGVGISGQEGMQAVNSSDYAIAQFRFLERLLLVHGRWNYIRISKLVLYMFYKNITLVLAQYWYGYLSGASGSKMYWEIGVQLYNVAFTGLPIVVVGVLDKDLPAPFSIEYPDLYRRGPDRFFFNMYTFCRWIAAAFYESLIIFVVMSYGFNASEKSAGSESRVEFGMVAFSLTVLIVNIKIWMIADRWTLLSFSLWFGSVMSWFGFAAIGTETPYFATFKIGYDEFGAFAPTAKTWGYFLVLIMGCSLALGRHVAYNLYQRTFHPDLAQLLQESMGGGSQRKYQRRLTINHMEEQTLSMSLDDVHTTGYLSDFGHSDAEILKAQHPQSFAATLYEQQPKKSASNVGTSAPQSTSSGVTDSYSASVFSESISEDATWERVPTKMFRGTTGRRNTGFAFSCDEETTLAESYIASNSLPRSDAISTAMRNSTSSTGGASAGRVSMGRVRLLS